MKKIFAIALALVMVLSMASAFAANCVVPDWACAEDVCALGKGKVEVVPFVIGNACAGDNTFTANTCAAALNNEWVFAAVKVTVDENPNEDWWAAANLEFDIDGMYKGISFGTANNAPIYEVQDDTELNATLQKGFLKRIIEKVPANKGKLKAGEYYLVPDTAPTTDYIKAVPAADFKAGWNNLFYAEVFDASIAKMCVSLVSDDAATWTDYVMFNGYKVYYNKNYSATEPMLQIDKGDKRVLVYVDADNKISKFTVKTPNEALSEVTTYNVDKTAFHDDAAKKDLSWTCTENGKFLKAVMDAFMFDLKTCVTEKAVETYFAWDDAFKACFSWSAKAPAVVDADCVVAIPKTGDASVLAWLF